jgi:MFS family permease
VRRSELLRSRPLLLTFVVVTLLTLTAQAMLETTASLWADARLGWGVREMGITFASVGVITALLQGGGAGPLNRRFGERQVLLTGLAVVCVGFVGVAIARDVTMAIAALVVIAIGTGLSGPALQSLLAAQATEEDRGVVMGLGQSASAMGRVVGPLIGGPLMAAYGASAPFVAGAAILGVAIAVLFIRPARAP